MAVVFLTNPQETFTPFGRNVCDKSQGKDKQDKRDEFVPKVGPRKRTKKKKKEGKLSRWESPSALCRHRIRQGFLSSLPVPEFQSPWCN